MNSRGFTLIELIVAIVIIGIGVASFAQLMNSSTINSIDPMVRQQAHAIARAYLEEISLRSFCDPNITSDCPGTCTTGSTCSNASCTNNGAGESRATFDDICDYDQPTIVDAIVTDQNGSTAAPIDELGDYRVTVDVIDDSGADLGTLTGGASQSLRIDVTVTHATNPNVDVTVSGFRANY
jgi:MSHA pilin protein MshD